jgi:hypothetical protein
MDGRVSLESLVDAIARLASDLPGLAGADWPKLKKQLEPLLAQARDRSQSAPLVEARLRSLLAAYPEVYRQVLAVAAAPPRPPAPNFARRGVPHEMEIVPAPPPRPRYANLAVLRASNFARIPPDRPLEPATSYFLKFDIGDLSPESVVRNAAAHAFPEERLPPRQDGHWLEVGVTSADFTPRTSIFPLFLPRQGSSWICGCKPGGDHSCQPHQREPHLHIGLRTPDAPGSAQVRVGVYFQNSLLQSLTLVADVAPKDTKEGGHAATVDYMLTPDLTNLDGIAPRRLSVQTGELRDGTHTLVFKEGSGEITFTLAEARLTAAMSEVRGLLLEAHIDQVGNSRRSRLDRNNGKSPEDFRTDLTRLARNGYELWVSLFQQQRDGLRDAKVGPSNTIQIARIPATSFVFPWAAVYDLPLDVAPDAKYEFCSSISKWNGNGPMLKGYSERCPMEDQHKPKNTLCPFGFWGVRHAIEHPPSTGRRIPQEVRARAQPNIVVVRSLALNDELADRHLASLRDALGDFALKAVASRDEACTALADELELIEFYCHGRGDGVQQWLEVGRDERIYPSQITTWQISDWAGRKKHWQETAPLVLLNGCHTVELTPQSPVSFVDALANASASGVVGTEITLDQAFANEAAELLLRHFASATVGLGEAVRRMRHDLLAKGNLLGLAYTAYCSADLRLRRQ